MGVTATKASAELKKEFVTGPFNFERTPRLGIGRVVKRGLRERVSFGKLPDVLELPDLVEVQRRSFRWFVEEGIREVFEEISPIQDFTGNLELYFGVPDERKRRRAPEGGDIFNFTEGVLDFGGYYFEAPKYSPEECRERDANYSAALKVRVRLVLKDTGEIKEQDVFMGDFPLMTRNGTFIINGAERVVVSQLVRSAGVYYSFLTDSSGRRFPAATVIPTRGAWLEFEIDATGGVYVRIDRTRKLPATVLLRAVGYESDEVLRKLYGGDRAIDATLEKDPSRDRNTALMEIYRRLRPGDPPNVESATALLHTLLFDPRRYDLGKVGRYKLNKKLNLDIRPDQRTLTPEDIAQIVRYLIALNNGEGQEDDIDHLG
ncbi:MAG: hypothetical protein K6U07_07035, partial [Firmicutes bacterium]|nr:hypothetical protein [Bacillota bacterium]